jgi:phosphopantetheinyl transferase (holo-ACP synthase)
MLVWRLEEEAPQLLALCRAAGILVDDLINLPVKRQREKSAERLLLCHAFGRPVTLSHDEQGAPFIDGVEENVSITHTTQLVAVAVDENSIIGLDAESADRSQVLRVRDKFLNVAERRFIAPDDLAAHIIAWTAKEAVIKAERNSAIDWTEGIVIEPFIVPDNLAEKLTFGARCGHRCYGLTVWQVEGHFLTLAVPSKP